MTLATPKDEEVHVEPVRGIALRSTELLAFRREGAGKQADKALQEALEVNPHVPVYLLGVKKLPRQRPAYVGRGDQAEAVWYVTEAAEPWVETPGALEWLAALLTHTAAPSPSAKPGRARHNRVAHRV